MYVFKEILLSWQQIVRIWISITSVYSSKSSVELTTLYYFLVPFPTLTAWLAINSTTKYEYNTYNVLPLRKDKLRIIHTFPLLELLVLNKTPRWVFNIISPNLCYRYQYTSHSGNIAWIPMQIPSYIQLFYILCRFVFPLFVSPLSSLCIQSFHIKWRST